jgi:ABC-type nitrate/sulfonate/bicarbonate transport system substrate-binding protein
MSVKIEYGVPTDRSGINVRFGVAKGFFAKEGIDLFVRVVFGGPEIADAYDCGALMIGELGTPPGITAISRGKRFKIIGSGLARGVSLHFIAQFGLESWSDLRGRTLGALTIGSCSYWYLRELLTQHGLDPDRDVVIRGLGPDYSRQLELLENGEIAALLTAEPNASLGESLGIARSWGDVFSLGDVPELQWVIQVANDEFLAREPDLVRKILRITQKSSQHLLTHRDEWIDFVAAVHEVPRDVAGNSITRELPFLHFDGQLDFPGLERAVALQHQLGAIAKVLPIEHYVAADFKPRLGGGAVRPGGRRSTYEKLAS